MDPIAAISGPSPADTTEEETAFSLPCLGLDPFTVLAPSPPTGQTQTNISPGRQNSVYSFLQVSYFLCFIVLYFSLPLTFSFLVDMYFIKSRKNIITVAGRSGCTSLSTDKQKENKSMSRVFL